MANPPTDTEELIKEQGAEEEQPQSFVATPNAPKDLRLARRSDIPLAPIFTSKRQDKIELEKQKTAQQNYVANLNRNLLESKKSLKRADDYLKNLEKAYESAKETNREAASQLADSISRVHATLKVNEKQKELIQEYVYEANERLREIHERVEKAEDHGKGAGTKAAIGWAKGAYVVGTFLSDTLGKKKPQKLTPKEFDRRLNVYLWEQSMKERLGLPPQMQKLTAEQFKESFDQFLKPVSSVVPNIPKAPAVTTPNIQTGKQAAASMGQAVGAAKSATGIAQKIKNIIKMVKNIRLLLAGTNPVIAAATIALLLKDKIKKLQQILYKIAAAIGAAIILFILWLFAKLMGILSGMAIGLVTGLPLLAIPGAGPFLYAGYVGYWAWRGWTDPLGTMHLATHPWELITRPISWVGDKLSGIGGSVKGGADAAAGGVADVTTGLASTAGSFITGTASAIWGGLTGAIGGAFSAGASAVSAVWGGITSLGSAVVGNVVPVAVGGSMLSVGGAAVMGTIITNSSFYTQDLDVQEQIFAPGQNQLFSISKRANTNQIANPPVFGTPITFTVTVAAVEALTNITLTDETRASNGSTFTTVNNCQGAAVPTSLPAGGTFSCTLVSTIIPGQNDSTVTNTATMTATGPDGTTENSSASATVRVGSAPQGCPSGWPVGSGSISQGPRGSYSHNRLYPTEQAIDIAYPTVFGTDTFATFTGTIVSRHGDNDNGYGKYVDIQGVCGGLQFIARWAHLDFIDSGVPNINETINSGTYIGDVDSTGNVTGPHLHYTFFGGLEMAAPYIPQSLADIYCTGETVCNLSW